MIESRCSVTLVEIRRAARSRWPGTKVVAQEKKISRVLEKENGYVVTVDTDGVERVGVFDHDRCVARRMALAACRKAAVR